MIGASSASGAGSPASARSRGAAPGPRRTRPTSGRSFRSASRSSALDRSSPWIWATASNVSHCDGLSRAASTPAAFPRLVSIAAAEVSSLACARCFRAAVASLPTSPVTRASAAWAVLHRGARAISASVAPIRASDSRTSRTRSWAAPRCRSASSWTFPASAATFAAVSSAASKSPSPKTSFARRRAASHSASSGSSCCRSSMSSRRLSSVGFGNGRAFQ